jgi:hypothetical protein
VGWGTRKLWSSRSSTPNPSASVLLYTEPEILCFPLQSPLPRFLLGAVHWSQFLQNCSLIFWIFFFFAALGLEFRVSHLLGRHSTWATLPALLSFEQSCGFWGFVPFFIISLHLAYFFVINIFIKFSPKSSSFDCATCFLLELWLIDYTKQCATHPGIHWQCKKRSLSPRSLIWSI